MIDGFVEFVVDEIKRANGCPCRVTSNPADLPVMRVAANSPPAAMVVPSLRLSVIEAP